MTVTAPFADDTLPLAVILYISAMCKGTKPLSCFGPVLNIKFISSLIVSRGLFFHFSKGLDTLGVKLIKVHSTKRPHEFSQWHLPVEKQLMRKRKYIWLSLSKKKVEIIFRVIDQMGKNKMEW